MSWEVAVNPVNVDLRNSITKLISAWDLGFGEVYIRKAGF